MKAVITGTTIPLEKYPYLSQTAKGSIVLEISKTESICIANNNCTGLNVGIRNTTVQRRPFMGTLTLSND